MVLILSGINNDVTFNNSSGDASGSTGTHTIFGMDTDISFTGVNDNNVTLYGLDTRVQITGAGLLPSPVSTVVTALTQYWFCRYW